MDATQRVVCPGVLAVGQDRRQCRTLGDRHRRLPVLPTHVGAKRVAGGEHTESLAVIRIDGGRFLEQSLRDYIILSCYSPVVRQRSHYEIPCVQAVGRLTLGAKIFRGIELRLDCGDDGLGNLVLHREDVGQVAVVALRPNMASGGDIVELHCDAHSVAAPAHAALNNVADAEFRRDLFHMDGFVFVHEGRVACDHEEPAQLGQRGDYVLTDAVGEIFLLYVAAHVYEGEHGDCGAIGQRQGRPRLFANFVRLRTYRVCRVGAIWLDADGPDEAKTFARYGADEFLIFTAIANCLPGGVDAARQCRI